MLVGLFKALLQIVSPHLKRQSSNNLKAILPERLLAVSPRYPHDWFMHLFTGVKALKKLPCAKKKGGLLFCSMIFPFCAKILMSNQQHEKTYIFTILPPRKTLQFQYLLYFYVKMPSSPDKIAAAAAPTLISQQQ